jgi:quinol monooxygenase YgiN
LEGISMSDQAGSYPGEATSLPPFPNPNPDWSQDDPAHPGFVLNGLDNTPGRKAYFILLEAKPGKEDLVLAFLRDINTGVDQEPMTGPWFALRYSKTTFCIFEAFPDVAGRNAHNDGPGGHNFRRFELLHDMLAYPAQIQRLDVLHGKFGVMLGKPVKPA